jgi:putative restriction endonuclease
LIRDGFRRSPGGEIRSDILHETDGPMLQHDIKEPHDKQILLPRDKQSRPDPLLLEKRYDRFKQAG